MGYAEDHLPAGQQHAGAAYSQLCQLREAAHVSAKSGSAHSCRPRSQPGRRSGLVSCGPAGTPDRRSLKPAVRDRRGRWRSRRAGRTYPAARTSAKERIRSHRALGSPWPAGGRDPHTGPGSGGRPTGIGATPQRFDPGLRRHHAGAHHARKRGTATAGDCAGGHAVPAGHGCTGFLPLRHTRPAVRLGAVGRRRRATCAACARDG